MASNPHIVRWSPSGAPHILLAMTFVRALAVLFVAVPLTACDKSQDGPPADVKTIAAFQEGKPAAGSTATIQGLVQATKGKAWPIVDRPGGPFVYCEMASPPEGVEKGARVVVTGKVADSAMLKECTLTPVKK